MKTLKGAHSLNGRLMMSIKESPEEHIGEVVGTSGSFLEKVTCRLRFENEVGTNLLRRREGYSITGSREHGLQTDLEVQ